MALFGKNTKKNADTAAPIKEARGNTGSDVSQVLRNPRITEKATDVAMRSVYVFDIAAGANKKMVAQAVERFYKVKPRMVRIAKVPAKTVRSMRTGRVGVKQGGRKAYVYLQQGDTIALA